MLHNVTALNVKKHIFLPFEVCLSWRFLFCFVIFRATEKGPAQPAQPAPYH